ncbi:(2Fe-2S)-binding protein [Actinoallomurus iriomotensis]|uniref:(2Fe-2S)-binding protein n=1 Tax=Actinoallomurus iriomotensis TaxID=478107 RepID=A0A9W6VU00_9ACTN|nr:(2Fe-2S)-binding protein [Actinoallomurus iriomotensis]GLY75462.1 (2Fe-2S)-binding protein [Actinoallomurus iriomotensis]GLY85043.1 (2Fe-2S)-binding protein [Actinoallomurus iriomotensis]
MTIERPRLPAGHGLERGPAVTVTVDGRPVTAYLGESVAAALMAAGGLDTRTTRGGERRGLFCGMGVCFDCLVIVDGVPGTRACVTWVREGMDIARQDGPGDRRETGDGPDRA